jgi:hypothetical protein
MSISWNGLSDPSETGGGAVTYSYRVDGSNWVAVGSATRATTSQYAIGNHKVEVRAQNNGSGNYSPGADSVTINIEKKPVPTPSADVVKGANPPAGWGTCSTSWHFVGASYSNVPAGNYKLTPMVGGQQIGTDIITVYLSGSGTVSTHGCVGNPGGQSVQVRFDGPGNTFYATTYNWNGLSPNANVHP